MVVGVTISILKITVFSFTAKTILLCLTALPIGIFALIGVGGESLTAFLLNFFRFLRNRKMQYRSDAMPEQEKSRRSLWQSEGEWPEEYGEEEKLIQSFVQRERPILGICRGMHALNIYFGGNLLDRIPNHQQPQGDLIHRTLTAGRLARLIGRCPTVTSNHHQALRHLGRDLQAVQVAPDGIIEAVAHTTLPILGVQWHPERQSFGLCRTDAVDAAPIFTHFIEQAR